VFLSKNYILLQINCIRWLAGKRGWRFDKILY